MKVEKIQKEKTSRTLQQMQGGGGTAQFVDNRTNRPIQLVAESEEEDSTQFKSISGSDTVQRAESDDEEDSVQRKADTTIQRKPNNTGLPDNLKSGIENLSGYSMDDVRVNYNSPKPAQLQAHAYTQGTDIYVAPGQERHLPHEAWHVVQQKQGRVQPTMQMKGVNVNDDGGLEREADVMGKKVVQNKVTSTQLVRQQPSVGKRCIQYKLPEGLTEKSKNGRVWLGNIKYRKKKTDGIVAVQINIAGEATKADALKQIAQKAGDIGNKCPKDSSGWVIDGNYNNIKENKINPFQIEIAAKYKTSGKPTDAGGQPTRKQNIVILTMVYHFGPFNHGYVVGVKRENKKEEKKEEAALMSYKQTPDPNKKYSNKHEASTNIILKDTKKVNDSKINLESKNWDAYTKLAGEGARFECVRDNIDKIKNDTKIYTKVGNKFNYVTFNELWLSWGGSFNKEFNIHNNLVVDKLEKKEIKNSGRSVVTEVEEEPTPKENIFIIRAGVRIVRRGVNDTQ